MPTGSNELVTLVIPDDYKSISETLNDVKRSLNANSIIHSFRFGAIDQSLSAKYTSVFLDQIPEIKHLTEYYIGHMASIKETKEFNKKYDNQMIPYQLHMIVVNRQLKQVYPKIQKTR
jgi:hypothetical protein